MNTNQYTRTCIKCGFSSSGKLSFFIGLKAYSIDGDK